MTRKGSIVNVFLVYGVTCLANNPHPANHIRFPFAFVCTVAFNCLWSTKSSGMIEALHEIGEQSTALCVTKQALDVVPPWLNDNSLDGKRIIRLSRDPVGSQHNKALQRRRCPTSFLDRLFCTGTGVSTHIHQLNCCAEKATTDWSWYHQQRASHSETRGLAEKGI